MKSEVIPESYLGLHGENTEGEKILVEENLESAEGGTVSKGEARYQAISAFIGNAGKKVSGWFKRGGELFKKGAIGALSAPEATVAGAKFVGNKVSEGVDFAESKAQEGVAFVGESIERGKDFADAKAEQVYEFSSDAYKAAKGFAGVKAEQAGDYLKDKALTVAAVASLATEKTGEQLGKAKDGIENTYGKAVKYGRGAVDSAILRTWFAQDAFNNKLNAIKKGILERKLEIQTKEREQTLRKLEQLGALQLA